MFYKVHYPDGSVKKHKCALEDSYLPGLEKVFYNGKNYYIISELNETDIWVEFVSIQEYNKNIFVYFRYGVGEDMDHVVDFN